MPAMLDVDFDSYLRGYPKESLSHEELKRIGSLPPDHPDRWKLVTHTMKFIVRWGMDFARNNPVIHDGESFLNALQDAAIRASKKFDGRGNTFLTYVTAPLKWAAANETIKQSSPARMPKSGGKANKHLFREKLDHYFPLSTTRPSEHLGDLMFYEGFSNPFEAPDRAIENKQLREKLEAAFENARRDLESRGGDASNVEAVIMKSVGTDGNSIANLHDIDKEFGMCRGWAGNLRKNHFKRMRKHLRGAMRDHR